MEAEDVHQGLIDRRKGILSSRTGEGIVRIVASCMSAGALPIPPVSARRRVVSTECRRIIMSNGGDVRRRTARMIDARYPRMTEHIGGHDHCQAEVGRDGRLRR